MIESRAGGQYTGGVDVALQDWQRGAVGTAASSRIRGLVDAHFSRIWGLLKRLGVPPALLDDATQQVFIVALKKLEGIEPDRERQYLQGIAVRVASDQRRAEKRRGEREEAAPAADPPPQPDELLERARARAMLDQVLEKMAFDLRVPFVLFELDELTIPEIATVLEVPEGTASSRLRRAREEFRRLVAELKEGLS